MMMMMMLTGSVVVQQRTTLTPGLKCTLKMAEMVRVSTLDTLEQWISKNVMKEKAETLS